MLNFLKLLLTPEFFFSIIRISAPILFATLAAIVVEKAGFCNIGLEGLMMFSALTGSLVSYYAHSWVWGLLAALAIGDLMSLLMGFFAFQLKTDITLVGIAINMMGSGGTLFLCKVITNLTEGTAMASSTGLINTNLLIPNINLPLISKIPFLGPILSGHNLLTWLAFLCCALTSVMLYKTSLGLNIRAVGENHGVVLTWWRRGELNSCPKTLQRELLRAQTLVLGFRIPVSLVTGQPSRRQVG